MTILSQLYHYDYKHKCILLTTQCLRSTLGQCPPVLNSITTLASVGWIDMLPIDISSWTTGIITGVLAWISETSWHTKITMSRVVYTSSSQHGLGTGTYPGNHQGVIWLPNIRFLVKWHPVISCKMFCIYVESKGILHKFYSYKTIGTLNDGKKQTFSCYVNNSIYIGLLWLFL